LAGCKEATCFPLAGWKKECTLWPIGGAPTERDGGGFVTVLFQYRMRKIAFAFFVTNLIVLGDCCLVFVLYNKEQVIYIFRLENDKTGTDVM
jgi:hypothetical protein